MKKNIGNKSKQYYFFCSLPRSGSTYLSSVLNQSKQIQVSANSILPDILFQLDSMKQTEHFLNFPYHQGIDNLINNCFSTYYQNINTKCILDKSVWGTPYNLNLLKKIFKERKFLILTRPLVDCLASFIKIEKPKNVSKRCSELMNKEHGVFGKSIWSITNLIHNKENYLKINYHHLLENADDQIKNIFNFFDLQHESLNTTNIKSFNFADTEYNDNILKGNFHELKKSEYKPSDFLPRKIIEEYKNIII